MRYARAVKRGPRIDVPSARDDELPIRSLLATSVACLFAGVLIAYGMADRTAAPRADAAEHSDRTPSASAGAEEPSPVPALAAEPEPAPPPPTAAAPVPPDNAAIAAADAGAPSVATNAPVAAAVSHEPDAAIAIATEPASDVEPAPIEVAANAADAPAQPEAAPDPPPDPRHLEIKPGVVAYLRCEGVPQRRGKYPCPRDRALEERIRVILEALPSCRDSAAIPRGRSFELRLELGASGGFKELLVKGPNEAAEKAVRACAGPALRKERTDLKSTRMIVSMRFKAR